MCWEPGCYLCVIVYQLMLLWHGTDNIHVHINLIDILHFGNVYTTDSKGFAWVFSSSINQNVYQIQEMSLKVRQVCFIT